VAALVTTPVATIFDLTDTGSPHLERCLVCWPHAKVYTVQDVGSSPPITRIVGPPFGATPDWGAAPAAGHGVLADLARRRAAELPPSAARAGAMTLDDYVQLEGIGPISLLLLSATLDAVEVLLGASLLLAGGRIHAIALLAPAAGTPQVAVDLAAGVLGKFDLAWASRDAGPVSLALRHTMSPGRPRRWAQLARTLGVPVTGIIRTGTDGAAGLSAGDDVASGPLFLIDANLPALQQRRQDLGGARAISRASARPSAMPNARSRCTSMRAAAALTLRRPMRITAPIRRRASSNSSKSRPARWTCSPGNITSPRPMCSFSTCRAGNSPHCAAQLKF
jgi:hypothetical protein